MQNNEKNVSFDTRTNKHFERFVFSEILNTSCLPFVLWEKIETLKYTSKAVPIRWLSNSGGKYRMFSIPTGKATYSQIYKSWLEIQEKYFDYLQKNTIAKYTVAPTETQDNNQKQNFHYSNLKYGYMLGKIKKEFAKNEYKFISFLDIKECFKNIYIHSFEWLENNLKPDKTSDLLVGIHEIANNLSSRETNGLCTGPNLSRILIEVLMARVDKVLTDEYNYQFKLTPETKNILIFRYVDDYYVLHNQKINNVFLKKVNSKLGLYNTQFHLSSEKKIFLNRKKIPNKKLRFNPENFVTSVDVQKWMKGSFKEPVDVNSEKNSVENKMKKIFQVFNSLKKNKIHLFLNGISMEISNRFLEMYIEKNTKNDIKNNIAAISKKIVDLSIDTGNFAILNSISPLFYVVCDSDRKFFTLILEKIRIKKLIIDDEISLNNQFLFSILFCCKKWEIKADDVISIIERNLIDKHQINLETFYENSLRVSEKEIAKRLVINILY